MQQEHTRRSGARDWSFCGLPRVLRAGRATTAAWTVHIRHNGATVEPNAALNAGSDGERFVGKGAPSMRPFFGYHMPSFTFAGVPDSKLFDRVVELAQSAEAAGFDLVTVMDHFYQIGGVGSEEEPMLEGYTALGGIAARTERVMLGTMVTGVTYRNPAMLAKTVTTLDIVSKGRAMLGIGAAWNESEHAGYGIDFPPIGEREDRLEEALTICQAMFTQDRPSFEGRYYRIDRALNCPRPIQPGGPKIMVGGGGEKRTLKARGPVRRHHELVRLVRGGLGQAGGPGSPLRGHRPRSVRDPANRLRADRAGGQRGRQGPRPGARPGRAKGDGQPRAGR